MTGLHEFADRFRTWILVGLLVLDIASLLLMVVIALNQNAVNDKLSQQTTELHAQAIINHSRSCRNSGILIADVRSKIAQTKNTDLYHQFFPQISPAQLKLVIAQQVQQQKREISELSQGCTVAQLSIPPPIR